MYLAKYQDVGLQAEMSKAEPQRMNYIIILH